MRSSRGRSSRAQRSFFGPAHWILFTYSESLKLQHLLVAQGYSREDVRKMPLGERSLILNLLREEAEQGAKKEAARKA